MNFPDILNSDILLSPPLQWISDHWGTLSAAILFSFGVFRVHRRASRARTARKTLQESIATQMDEPITLHPEVDPMLCVGCGACTRVCPEGDILRLIDHKAVLVSPTKCVGHGECEQACPTGAIQLVFGTKTRGMEIPRITGDYETNIPGVYIAGELGGMGLIRNAVKQGRAAASHALAHLEPDVPADTDLLVVGAGPAGIAAALSAIAQKKTYVLIEQNSFGGTVFNYPRQKVVMSYPADLPLVGQMKFGSHRISKEELLSYWNEIRDRTKLRIREHTQFESLALENGAFTVKASGSAIRARKVVLAMGVRGTPRKLGLPNEDLPKVTYNLLEPEQYQKRKLAVVGGGNAAVEAAQALCRPALGNQVSLLVHTPRLDRCNDENRKIIEEMARKGWVDIRFDTAVKEIHPDHLLVQTSHETERLENDYLLIFAGAEMPHRFLMSLGIEIDKKFGEALKK